MLSDTGRYCFKVNHALGSVITYHEVSDLSSRTSRYAFETASLSMFDMPARTFGASSVNELCKEGVWLCGANWSDLTAVKYEL